MPGPSSSAGFQLESSRGWTVRDDDVDQHSGCHRGPRTETPRRWAIMSTVTTVADDSIRCPTSESPVDQRLRGLPHRLAVLIGHRRLAAFGVVTRQWSLLV